MGFRSLNITHLRLSTKEYVCSNALIINKNTREKVARIGAYTIYANNDNRRYCSEHGIITCFVRKGPKPKDENAKISTACRIIGSLRATAMEGSFGNQKQHYGVGRIAARNSRIEALLLFFAIHMANAAILAARQIAKEDKEKQDKRRRKVRA